MKKFLMKMWVKGMADEAKIRSYCPFFLTWAEVEEILAVFRKEKNA